jgi:hypothetical protein
LSAVDCAAEQIVPKIAYLSQGQLFLLADDGVPAEVTSQFAREFEDRQARQQEVQGWKERSGIWGNMGFSPPQFSQWQAPANRAAVRFLGLDRGPAAGQLAYLLGLGQVTGLFTYETSLDRESRLFHKTDFPAGDLAQHRRLGTFAMSVDHGGATRHLVVADPDGRFPREVTAGDTVDERPRWVDTADRQLVYQSCGLVRDVHGNVVGLGPYSIQRLDLDGTAIEEVLASDDHDLLQPCVGPDGALYFVRRPYSLRQRRHSVWTDLQDVALFPFRLARAVFGFLNLFSVMFSGKPLRTAGGPERPRVADNKLIMLWGQMVDTRQKMFQRQQKTEAGLVPRNWELVRRAADGQESILRSGVLTYDVDGAGNVVSTDGQRIFLHVSDGTVRELTKDRFVERVVLLDNLSAS